MWKKSILHDFGVWGPLSSKGPREPRKICFPNSFFKKLFSIIKSAEKNIYHDFRVWGPRGPRKTFFPIFLKKSFGIIKSVENAFFMILGFGALSVPRGPGGPEKLFFQFFLKSRLAASKVRKNAFFMILGFGTPMIT